MSMNVCLEKGRLRNGGGRDGGGLAIAGLRIVADGRLLGLSAGDRTVLLGGFGLSALALFAALTRGECDLPNTENHATMLA
jgi:hypothetical protein